MRERERRAWRQRLTEVKRGQGKIHSREEGTPRPAAASSKRRHSLWRRTGSSGRNAEDLTIVPGRWAAHPWTANIAASTSPLAKGLYAFVCAGVQEIEMQSALSRGRAGRGCGQSCACLPLYCFDSLDGKQLDVVIVIREDEVVAGRDGRVE